LYVTKKAIESPKEKILLSGLVRDQFVVVLDSGNEISRAASIRNDMEELGVSISVL
jgi:hypothetical protein